MQKVLEPIKLYFVYSKYMAKSLFQYRLDACFRTFAVLLREFSSVFVVYLTLQKFQTLNGWRQNEILFLFSFLYLTYSIMLIFFTGLRDFGYLVHGGALDRFLVRPRGLLYQVLTHHTDYLASIGYGTVGVVLFFATANMVNVVWDAPKIFYCLMVVISGVLIQSALFMLFSSASFFFIRVNNLQDFLFYNTRKFAGYPISIFPQWVQKIMIFLVPFAFVNFFPTEFFLRKEDLTGYWQGYLIITPFIGFAMFALALCVWKFSIKYYKSSGT